jgi:hypothetical protein
MHFIWSVLLCFSVWSTTETQSRDFSFVVCHSVSWASKVNMNAASLVGPTPLTRFWRTSKASLSECILIRSLSLLSNLRRFLSRAEIPVFRLLPLPTFELPPLPFRFGRVCFRDGEGPSLPELSEQSRTPIHIPRCHNWQQNPHNVQISLMPSRHCTST